MKINNEEPLLKIVDTYTLYERHDYKKSNSRKDVQFCCDQYDYKTKRKDNLKRHKEYGHGNVWHSCDQKTKKKLLLVLQLANLKTDEPTRQRNKISGHI